MFDGKAFGEEIVGIVQDYVDKAVAPLKAENEALQARIKALEEQTGPDLEALTEYAIVKAVAALPPPKEGQPGKDGEDGKDGAGLIDGFVSRDGHLIATLSDGTTRDFGEIIGKDGEPGKDGRDGIDLTSFDAIVLDDDRTIELKFVSGDEERVASFKWPNQLYRGVYREGTEYERGDTVTWAGCQWHCDTPTTAKPGTEDWTKCVNKGRDGKDAK